MQLSDEFCDLVDRAALQVEIDELADEHVNWRALFLLNGATFGWIDIVHGVFDEHAFLLTKVLCSLLAIEGLQERRHSWRSLWIAQQIPATILHQAGHDLNVHAREVFERDFQAVEDDMLGYNAKLGQFSQVSNILHAHLTQKVLALAPLQASKLIVEVADQRLRDVWHVLAERRHETRVERKEVRTTFRNLFDGFDEPVARCSRVEEAEVHGCLVDTILA